MRSSRYQGDRSQSSSKFIKNTLTQFMKVFSRDDFPSPAGSPTGVLREGQGEGVLQPTPVTRIVNFVSTFEVSIGLFLRPSH